jgi:ATP-dependent protease ClpP protease subunit
MGKSWFSITAAKGDKPASLSIYDEIGRWGVTVADFARDLRALGDLKGKPLALHISSPGGDVFAGNTMANLLKETGAKITVHIDGLAASMASLIAMVGDPVIIARNGMMMIHNPAAIAAGNSKEMKRIASLLDSLRDGMVNAYSSKSGLEPATIIRMMDEETWFEAEDAVAQGFADSISDDAVFASFESFDLTKFKHPPSITAVAAPALPSATDTEVPMDKTELAALLAENNKSLVTALADALKPKAEAKVEGAETPEQIAARVNKERDDYEAEVKALCALAGFADKADGYITAKKPLADVRAELVAEKAKKPAPKTNGGAAASADVHNHGDVEDEEDTSDLVVKSLDSAKIWARYNKAGGETAKLLRSNPN